MTWQEDPVGPGQAADSSEREKLVLRLDAYEGPIDLLLEQARNQKVDLSQISVLALVDQYIEFMEQIRDLRLELAADYLVMAAWLAYLKSRLLLPEAAEDDEPTGEEMAEALAFQLRRLEAMREAGRTLAARKRLGISWFPRGETVPISNVKKVRYEASLFELLKAYATVRRGADGVAGAYPERLKLMAVDDAIKRMRHLLGIFPGWNRLESFLPNSLRDRLHSRSAMAAHFSASLELVKHGQVEMRQSGLFRPIFVRSCPPDALGEDER